MTAFPRRPRTFVLVHGAWRGGWCYADVAIILRRAGHFVFTPTLTGLGERSHLASGVNLETHITDILNVIEWERLDRVILVGHSYGGMVITAVADRLPGRVEALIYLDAAVPASGDTVLSTLTPDEAAKLVAGAGADGTNVPPPPAASFGHHTGESVVTALSTPHPLACFTQAVNLTGAHEQVLNKVYVLATKWAGSMALPHYKRVRRQAGWRTECLDASHDMMIDDPEATAAMLLNLLAQFEAIGQGSASNMP